MSTSRRKRPNGKRSPRQSTSLAYVLAAALAKHVEFDRGRNACHFHGRASFEHTADEVPAPTQGNATTTLTL
jgi:hypothetical protein